MPSIVVFLLLIIILNNGQSSFDITDLDWSIRPSDNFFMFVNGRWINRTIIPSFEVEWGGIYTMKYENKYKLKQILDDLIQNQNIKPSDSHHTIERNLIDFYLAGLDEHAIERVGLEPLKETLIELQNIQTYQELIDFVLHWYKKMNQGLIFDFDVAADERNTSINMVNWRQTGVQLPERNYYFLNDSISQNIRFNYLRYINRLLQLSNPVLNITTHLTDAEEILSLETQLVRSHRSAYQLRDAELNYNKYTIDQLNQLMPNLAWQRILSILTIENQTVLIGQPDYYQLLDKLIISQPLTIWKNKIRFTLLHEMSLYLNQDFVRARFQMFNHLIYGQHEDKVCWMKMIEKMNKYLGELFGQLFIRRYFSLEAKERTIDLVKNLIDVYRERINQIHWLSNSTKDKAVKKLRSINIKIGYPSKWKSYDDVFINRSSYFKSISSIFQHDFRKKIRELRKCADRNEWIIPPQIVNAFYYPPYNDILFPAAILQEPFFSFHADDALNYGGIGYVIGHELTHCFDDQGRKYDENGNLHHWWTLEDIIAFEARTEMLVKQFENYQIYNRSINTQLTLGENMADLGGLEIAYQAFLRTKQAKDGVLIDGFTPEQRFFLAAARTWRVKLTKKKLLSNLKDDSHAPAILRINGPLSNMMGFYRAFNVTKGDAMFRKAEDRILIW